MDLQTAQFLQGDKPKPTQRSCPTGIE